MTVWIALAASVLALGQTRSPISPSPAEAIRGFQLPPGFRIELVASDPQIESPVAMAFGADGKMWVVEMRDYPHGPKNGEPPAGRIRVLEDKDGDGRYETATIFADNLLFANGLLPWKDGVIVTAAPHIIHLRDTDGDGKADVRDILFEGFAVQNPQLRVSHPVLGLDGWVYVANGLRGGSIISKKQKDAKPIPLAGMDFRFNPITFEGEAIAGMGQFGNTFDDWGNRFVCDNRNHLRHVVLENRYVRRNPHLAVPTLVEDVSDAEPGPLSSGAPIYPLSKNWTTSNLHAGRFTAACGVFIYRGHLLPFNGDAFTCDPTGNLVHREILKPHGATFRAQTAYDKKEFLATADDWFRPVFLAHGPEGAIYVVDMQRAVIEHPEFMPPELRNQPNLAVGKDKGRIWRIVPESYKRLPADPTVRNDVGAEPARLLSALENVESWRRLTAARLLFEKLDRSFASALGKIITSSSRPHARLQAGWMFQRFDPLGENLAILLGDDNPNVRAQAVLMTEPFLAKSETVRERVAALAIDADPRVRFQVALSLGEWDDDGILPALANIAARDDLDRWTRYAIASSVAKRAGKLIERVPTAHPATLRELAAIVGSRRDEAEIARTMKALRLIDDHRRRAAVVLGLADGLARRGATLDADDPNIRDVLDRAGTQAALVKDPHADRLDAIRLLAHDARHAPTLLELLKSDPSPEIKIKAMQSLSSHVSAEVGKTLIASWSEYSPALRQEVANALLQRPDRVKALLQAVEDRAIAPRELDAVTIRRLSQHPMEGDRARKLLAAAQPGDRKKAIERFRESLSLTGDPLKGRDVFKKTCAACHKIAGIGQITGPDISDTRTKTTEQLLHDILDPNAAIDANSIAYLATTKSGKTYSGLIAGETASSITLRRAEGQTDVILRGDLDELRSTGKSLMPEGLEADMSVRQMADLLSFLKNWRYLE